MTPTPQPPTTQQPDDGQRPEDAQHPDSTQQPTSTPHPTTQHPEDAQQATSTRWSKEFLAPREVAALLRVNPKTVSNWARKGHLDAVPTPGGYRRFHTNDIQAFIRGLETR